MEGTWWSNLPRQKEIGTRTSIFFNVLTNIPKKPKPRNLGFRVWGLGFLRSRTHTLQPKPYTDYLKPLTSKPQSSQGSYRGSQEGEDHENPQGFKVLATNPDSRVLKSQGRDGYKYYDRRFWDLLPQSPSKRKVNRNLDRLATEPVDH